MLRTALSSSSIAYLRGSSVANRVCNSSRLSSLSCATTSSRFVASPQIAKRLSTTTATTVPTTGEPNYTVAYWLFGVGGLVASMVTIGGITRLTKSGLSMVDWNLQGGLPPITKEEWEKEFEKFKQFPEWQQRQSMTLDEFKFIYFWEYGHRMMGRVVGLAFVAPCAYFLARGKIPRHMYGRMAALFSLGFGQGLIGWWMVKSGLNLDPQQRKEIRVSPYRLATHLSMAFTTYTLLLWTGLDLINSPEKAKNIAKLLPTEVLKYAKAIRTHAAVNVALVAATVVSGAYVAGNDAGRAYNSFPKMGDDWIPAEILEMTPVWKNFFENTATVQFDHRVLALTSLCSITGMYVTTLRAANGRVMAMIPRFAQVAMHGAMGMGLAQVSLGVATLLLYVPIPLAAVHQFGSLTLLTILTCLVHSLNFSRYGRTTSASAAKVLNTALLTVQRNTNKLK